MSHELLDGGGMAQTTKLSNIQRILEGKESEEALYSLKIISRKLKMQPILHLLQLNLLEKF